jgi:hypothetical protein
VGQPLSQLATFERARPARHGGRTWRLLRRETG